ncbi:RNA polymerase sigma-70 factor (ECF subfamily) [Paenibacillus endophyticus]|uniref:RNA polymerase sigma-70 factor (ECF subfamily) n=1 Tax=Paenibacillus endophyticus TaxID=1294268 RepID=A0A7W5GAI7_9BACL|nr:sigma-70 family RNA polymerase sigma factor [Paenibacillus endophyticus]MBB3152022.1 RNA polymerase sigma-70 factor (ECF subfamily) [Paenibacillus endophyticus]
MAAPNSIDELYMLYMKDVYRYLLFLCQDRHTAEDIVQETFYRAYLYLDSYKGERVKPWLFRTAHHALIDYKRKEKRTSPQEAAYFENLQSRVTPEMLFLHKERLSELGILIDRLREKQKQALLLHDWHELSYAESADIMGVGLSHYKVLLFRARQTLRQLQREAYDV